METTTIAKVNYVSILVYQNQGNLVPIKPICDALGIDVESQRKKINSDEILHSVAVLSTATGSDEKKYGMTCLPLKFIFGWLFTINSKNVNKDARENVIRYKLECYNALYNHFALKSEFLEEKQAIIDSLTSIVDEAQKEFSTKKEYLAEVKKKYNEARILTFEQWQANKRQLSMDFQEGKEES